MAKIGRDRNLITDHLIRQRCTEEKGKGHCFKNPVFRSLYLLPLYKAAEQFSQLTYRMYCVLSYLVEEEVHWSFSLNQGLRLTVPLKFMMAKRVATQLGRRSEPRLDNVSLAGPTP